MVVNCWERKSVWYLMLHLTCIVESWRLSLQASLAHIQVAQSSSGQDKLSLLTKLTSASSQASRCFFYFMAYGTASGWETGVTVPLWLREITADARSWVHDGFWISLINDYNNPSHLYSPSSPDHF